MAEAQVQNTLRLENTLLDVEVEVPEGQDLASFMQTISPNINQMHELIVRPLDEETAGKTKIKVKIKIVVKD